MLPEETTTKQTVTGTSDKGAQWIGRSEIVLVDGALKPSAYVARAYKESLKHGGQPPEWARQLANGRWLFDVGYIRRDAEKNAGTIGIDEAARILGATRRAVQTWVDQGKIKSPGGTERGKGARRRITRATFMKDLPRLRKRLETPAVIGYKQHRHRPSPQESREDQAIDATTVPHAAREEAAPQSETQRLVLALEMRLRAARAARNKNLVTQTPAKTSKRPEELERPSKASTAKELELKLREARDSRKKQSEWEAHATAIAERLVDDVFGNQLKKSDAILMYGQFTAEKGIPPEIRAQIRKQFFGR